MRLAHFALSIVASLALFGLALHAWEDTLFEPASPVVEHLAPRLSLTPSIPSFCSQGCKKCQYCGSDDKCHDMECPTE